MATQFTDDDIIEVLVANIERAGSQAKAAAELGVSGPFLHDVIKKSRNISAELARKLGYERQMIFVPLGLDPADVKEEK